MKRIAAIIILSCMSMQSFAVKNTFSILTNGARCESVSKSGNLTACFQNKVDSDLSNYELKTTLIYTDGTWEENISNLSATQAGHFAVISASSLDLQAAKISSAWFSIIEGDAMKYHVMPGCSIEVTPNSVSKSVISVMRIDGNLICTE